MKDKLKLLIVEDDESQLKAFRDTIALYNKERGEYVTIDASIKMNLEEGMAALSDEDYDAAVVDLKLSSSSDDAAEGNKIVKKIKSELRFPVIVRSGYTNILDENLEAERGPFFKIYERTEKRIEEILNEVVEIYQTGITRMLGKDGRIASEIDNYLHKIFWKHISNSFDSLMKSSLRNEGILLRYILTHLIEYLSLPDFNTSNLYFSGEMYTIPSIKDDLFTGVLLNKFDSDDLFIILTPACDMVVRKSGKIKAPKILLVEIDNAFDLEEIKSETSTKSKKKILEKLLKNDFSLYYHFLPPAPGFPGGFINFRKVNSWEEENIKKSFSIVGKITKPFLKDIIARFSAYYARQGQPDFDIPQIAKEILSGYVNTDKSP
jgi:hypothetical protein